MPRTRELKPAFFQDEDLATLSRDHRLLFEALWTLADREGRLEDRPAFIKLYSFPFDADIQPADIDKMLTDLAEHAAKFIRRYRAAGKSYLVVNNLKKHQHIHPKEAASEIPGPESPERAMELPGNSEVAVEGSNFLPLPSLPSLSSSTHTSACDPCTTEHVALEQGTGKPTPYNVVSMFLGIRTEILGQAGRVERSIFAQPAQTELDKAGKWISTMTAEESSDIEPAIRLACKHVKDGANGWTHEALSKSGFLLGSIVQNWRDLREELHGCAPVVKPRKPDGEPKPTKTSSRLVF